MARENRLWKWLSRARDVLGDDLHMERIENSLAGGFPDVEGCYLGGHFTIELKSAKRPVRPTTPIRFHVRQAQVDWHNARVQAGGRSWWLLQVGEGSARRIYLLPGLMGSSLVKGMTELDIAAAGVVGHDRRVTPEEVVTLASGRGLSPQPAPTLTGRR